ncbi:hypothetical protein BPAE_0115g00100 [Botrytis paeoniae]|uniref:Uncharacterized protein n=1 Tax=Botrytis paeoniae TaxID=278948 RepID=A0A4Z1FQS7_9HELO|nr:hypothetical protein BPAE_0115g00100 [Botrytis paeoniae]
MPTIVTKTPGYDRVGKNGEPKAKFGVYRWDLTVKEIWSAVSENLMHSTTWPADPWAPRRVIKFLQFIMSQPTFTLPIYIMDNKDGGLENSLIKCLRGMRKELRDGNPFRAYLSQKFILNSTVPTIESGASIKDARSRPNIVTGKQLQYCTKEEILTRLAIEYLVTNSLVVLAHYAAQLRARCFGIITANTQQLNTEGRNAPVICKAFDIARKAKACVNISKSMDARHSNLLLHRHVHAVGGVRAYAT